MELVSVIMSTYNESMNELELSITSILEQTWTNIEFIIVIDNPDNREIKKLINNYAEHDSRIRIISNEKNIGLAESLNKAWRASNGKYIVRMDADDISKRERIEKEMKYLLKYQLDMVATGRINISEKGKIIGLVKNLPRTKQVEALLPYGNFITHSTVMIKKVVLEKMNGYRKIQSVEDYDLWLRMLTSKYKIGILKEELLYYRFRDNSISRQDSYKQYVLQEYILKLYKMRKIKNGEDSFSEEQIQSYLDKKYTLKKKEKYNLANSYFDKAYYSIKHNKYYIGLYFCVKSAITSKIFFNHLCKNFLFQIKKKIN